MIALFWKISVGAVLVSLSLLIFHYEWTRPSDRSTASDQVLVSHNDITNSVRLQGRLGRPLGTVVTVRGKWLASVSGIDFEVYQVNSSILDRGISFTYHSVQDILGGMFGSKKRSSKFDPWDWSLDSDSGPVAPPHPAAGEEWAMLGIEAGPFQWYSPEVWAEARRFDAVPSPPTEGFVTSFRFMAIKKLN